MLSIKLACCPHFDQKWGLPKYETRGSSGVDLRAMLLPQTEWLLRPHQKVLIPTGLKFEVPLGYEMQIRPRSGLSWKTGLMVINSPGTIDADYRGEVNVLLANMGIEDEVIKHGDRIAQAVFAPIVQVLFQECTDLSETVRQEQGFGHTGLR
jgi:dUTP pyrophosphatase